MISLPLWHLLLFMDCLTYIYMLTVITNCKIYTGESVLTGKAIHAKDGLILGIEDQNSQQQLLANYGEQVKIIDLQGGNISPGLIDIQINGGTKRYFSQSADIEALTDIYETCCLFGTPFILPTIISSPLPKILQAIESVRKFKQKHSGVLGMHLQGPFFNQKKRGAHKLSQIRKPTNEELKQIIDKGKDIIKVMTIAPECFTEEQLEMLMQSGIVLSLGHSELTYQQTQFYFKKGIKLVTHLYNAMTQMGQRECGTVGAVFDNPDVYASIILDGGHCHYAAARIAHKQKSDKLILVTDSSFLGRKVNQFSWQGWDIQMVNGFYRDKSGNLAGAAISMPEAIKNAIQHLGVTLQQAIEMATSKVAKAIKMENSIGYIKSGYPAQFFTFDQKIQKYNTLIL